MIFRPTALAGACLIELEPHVDERGFFARSLCAREFVAHGLPATFPQCNLSRNTRAGTLRGMHFQAGPDSEAKVVRAVRGAIYDVIVDVRRGSATFSAWYGAELSAASGLALFVPSGFAHGFVTLHDDTDVFYHMSDFFRPDKARGFRWNDPRFAIKWPRRPTMISDRDAAYPDFDERELDA